jgi:hypothetical protein
MRTRSLLIVLVIAAVIAAAAVAARGHGGMRKWVMAIHGRSH